LYGSVSQGLEQPLYQFHWLKSILKEVYIFPSRLASRPVIFFDENLQTLKQKHCHFLLTIFIYGSAKKTDIKKKRKGKLTGRADFGRIKGGET